MFALVFYSSVALFLIGKMCGLPIVYPIIGIATLALQGNSLHLIWSKRFYVLIWFLLLAYALLFLPDISDTKVAISFLLTPLYALALVCLEEKYGFDQRQFVRGALYFSIFLAGLFLLGVALHFQEIRPLLTLDHIVLELRRGEVALRNLFFDAVYPFSENNDVDRAVVSSFGMLLVALSMFIPLNGRGLAAFSVLLFLNVVTFNRGMVIWSLGLLLVGFLAKSKKSSRVLVVILLFIPRLILSLEPRLSNGRIPVWADLVDGFSWWGKGLGSSSKATQMISANLNQNPVIKYPHNIHIEMIYDWGFALYLIFVLAALFYCYQYARVRTTFVLFFILFLNYSIYSPWSVWLLLFAIIADKRALGQSGLILPKSEK